MNDDFSEFFYAELWYEEDSVTSEVTAGYFSYFNNAGYLFYTYSNSTDTYDCCVLQDGTQYTWNALDSHISRLQLFKPCGIV